MIEKRGFRTEAHIETFKLGPDGEYIPDRHIVVPNVITTVGDKWINDQLFSNLAGYSATGSYNAPAGMVLGISGTAATKSDNWVLSQAGPTGLQVDTEFQAFSSVTDDEANGRVSWACSWSADQCDVANIQEVAIVPNVGPVAVGTDEAIVRVVFAPVDKSGADTPLNITIHWTSNNPVPVP